MTAFTTAYPGLVKSIQRGVVDMDSTASKAVTITAVVTGKTEMRYVGATCFDSATSTIPQQARITLTNTTTVTLTTSVATNGLAAFELTEYY